MASESRSACSVCLRSVSVGSTGLIRVHGPVTNRCQGSHQPPASSRPLTLTTARHAPTRGVDAGSRTADGKSTETPSSAGELSLCDFGFGWFPRVKILKRLPRASREPANLKLASILEGVVNTNSLNSWERLFHFSARCLRVPPRGGRRWSLASFINKQLREEKDPPDTKAPRRKTRQDSRDKLESLGHQVSMKLEEGDFKGAVRLACSEDSTAERSEATYLALKEKHPSPHPHSVIPPFQNNTPLFISVSEGDVAHAIKSFPNGSAGGPDGLRPQHLKDMINPLVDVSPLLTSLAAFSTMVLEGKTPPSVRPYFFGASLIALEKRGGGIRPIAVGCTLRRLVAKIAGYVVADDIASLLAPKQLGYGIRNGAEAAVHATRQYIDHLQPNHAVLKLDFKNAFNSIYRDKMLEAVQILAPDIYSFVYSAYSSPSFLFWGDKRLQSSEGVQQGDPLGPLLFCLSIFRPCSQLSSELCIMYLDDITLGGTTEDILHDLGIIESAANIGLTLNNHKSEIITNDPVARGTLISSFPEARLVDPSAASLLGSPLGLLNSISTALKEKVTSHQMMGDRLKYLSAHDSLLLLRNSFAIPKLLHILRTSPCFLSPFLQSYDETLRSIVSDVTNIHFADGSDPSWIQAMLPIKFGGLGIRSAVQLAPSAFLASAVPPIAWFSVFFLLTSSLFRYHSQMLLCPTGLTIIPTLLPLVVQLACKRVGIP